jgi:hypothetical protein
MLKRKVLFTRENKRILEPEDGNDMLSRNVGKNNHYLCVITQKSAVLKTKGSVRFGMVRNVSSLLPVSDVGMQIG